MKTLNKMQLISLLLTLFLGVMMAVPAMSMAVPAMSMAAQPTVNLGTTSTFAVLAGTTITNTGSTTISGSLPEGGGNIGVSPQSAITGLPPGTVTGIKHLNDTSAIQAKTDLVAAYLDAAGRTPTTTFTATENQLGGKTLKSGVYAFGHATTANLTAARPLILDAEGNENAVFIFQASSDLITASGSKIILTNSARFCRVFWQVTSSATLGTNSTFVGHIFALTSIAAQTGATVQGQLLARNGAVTLDTNTITNGLCPTLATSTTTTLGGTTSTTLDGGPTTTTPGGTTTTLGGATSTTLGGGTTTTATAPSGGTTTTAHGGGTTTTRASTTTTTPSDATTTTAPGGRRFPKTGLPLANVLLVGAALVLTGVVGRWGISRKLPR